MPRRISREDKFQAAIEADVAAQIEGNPPLIIRSYEGRAEEAASDFAAEAEVFALHGYLPVSQVWANGAWDSGTVIVSVILALFAVGLLLLAYMLVASPDGVLTVIYRPSADLQRP